MSGRVFEQSLDMACLNMESTTLECKLQIAPFAGAIFVSEQHQNRIIASCRLHCRPALQVFPYLNQLHFEKPGCVCSARKPMLHNKSTDNTACALFQCAACSRLVARKKVYLTKEGCFDITGGGKQDVMHDMLYNAGNVLQQCYAQKSLLKCCTMAHDQMTVLYEVHT